MKNIELSIFRQRHPYDSCKQTQKRGFSLVELIVVIAIMAVMAAVLVPSLIKYTESSRKAKDEHTVDELANAVQLALADSKIYDELVQYSAYNNVSCYIDTKTETEHQTNKIWTKKDTMASNKGEYTFSPDARLLDETRYIAAGNMRGVTITWHPNEKQKYTVSDGIINKWMPKKGKIADTKTLLSRVESTVGKELGLSSQTYRNSDYTLFIGLNSTGGKAGSAQNAIKIYGQFDGTNLPMADINFEKTPDRLTDVNIKEEYPFMDDKTPVYDEDDLTGGGNTGGGNKPGPDETVPGETTPVPEETTPGSSGGGGEGQPDPEQPLPPDPPSPSDPQTPPLEGHAYAFFGTDDTKITSLNFVRSTTPIKVGDVLHGKTVTQVFDDVEEIEQSDPAWTLAATQDRSKIPLETNIFDPIKPKSLRLFFLHNLSTTINGIEKLDTSNVTDMSGMFNGCRSLTQLDLSNFNTSNVTDMTSMFYGCSSLTQLDLSNFNTSNVSGMSGMFEGCSSLTQLDLSNFNTSKVSNMTRMFYSCWSLKQLDVSNFNTSNVSSMISMFHGCLSLTQLDLSNFNTSKVKDFSSMFANCKTLKTIYCDADWDISAGDNVRSYRMFDKCPMLIGGNGTKYNPNKTDINMAVRDLVGSPGYFTSLNPNPQFQKPNADRR